MPLQFPAIKLKSLIGLVRVYEVRSFLISVFPTAAILVLQLVTFIIVGRNLGATGFGEYSATTAVTSVLVEVIGCGGGDILVRGVILRPEQYKRYFGSALLLIGWTLPVVAAGGVAATFWVMHVGVPIAPLALFVCSEIFGGRLAATGEMLSNAKRDILGASFMRSTLVVPRFALAIVTFTLAPKADLTTWLLCCVGQSILMSAITYVYLVVRYGGPQWRLVDRQELGTGLLFGVAQTARASQSNLDRAFLAAFSMGPVLGAYAAASRVTQLGLFPIQLVNRIIYPKFFAHGARGVVHGRRFALKCAPMLAGVGAVSGFAVAGVGFVIPKLLGHGFAEARPFALALATAVPIMAVQFPAADALTASGRQALRATIYALSAVGFGFLLVAGAAVGGAPGLTVAFIVGHLFLAVLLWSMLFMQRDEGAGAVAS